MPASIYRGQFTVGEFPLPDLWPWQILVRPIANGICGSDLSAWAHTDNFLTSNAEARQELYLVDKDRPLVFGHEFTAEVTELGPEVSVRPRPGGPPCPDRSSPGRERANGT